MVIGHAERYCKHTYQMYANPEDLSCRSFIACFDDDSVRMCTIGKYNPKTETCDAKYKCEFDKLSSSIKRQVLYDTGKFCNWVDFRYICHLIFPDQDTISVSTLNSACKNTKWRNHVAITEDPTCRVYAICGIVEYTNALYVCPKDERFDPNTSECSSSYHCPITY